MSEKYEDSNDKDSNSKKIHIISLSRQTPESQIEIDEFETEDLDVLDQFKIKEFRFKEITRQHNITGKKEKKTKEDVFEFEFYNLMINLLSVIYAFEEGTRKPLKAPDYYEMLGSLEHTFKTLKGNIKYLEDKD